MKILIDNEEMQISVSDSFLRQLKKFPGKSLGYLML